MENPNKRDDLGVPLFLETPIYVYDMYLFNMQDGASFNCDFRTQEFNNLYTNHGPLLSPGTQEAGRLQKPFLRTVIFQVIFSR